MLGNYIKTSFLLQLSIFGCKRFITPKSTVPVLLRRDSPFSLEIYQFRYEKLIYKRSVAKKIEIIIVTFNSQRDIAALLDSLRAQNWQDFAVTIIDNASADKTIEIAKRFNIKIL